MWRAVWSAWGATALPVGVGIAWVSVPQRWADVWWIWLPACLLIMACQLYLLFGLLPSGTPGIPPPPGIPGGGSRRHARRGQSFWDS